MKLVEILARELKEWPEGCVSAIQSQKSDSRLVYFYGCGDGFDRKFSERASDVYSSEVTRAQWEAERARIASNQQATQEARDIARTGSMTSEEQELADIACGKRSKEDQELWDKVAREHFIDFVQGERQGAFCKTIVECMELAGIAADAFMAERAKRMKG